MRELENLTSRRHFVKGAALLASAPAAGLVGASPAQGQERREGGLIVRGEEPRNLEFPFSTLRSFITPNEQFYIRNHFSQPSLDAREWRLRVEGAVERPFELTYEELLRLPSRSHTMLLECAGNNRSFLQPPVRGVQWQLGSVGNAEWTGVPLAALLERARVKSRAVEVILEGADSGKAGDLPGTIQFARSLPMEKARRGDVLLAHQMNGAQLPASHGFPVRAVVPGWYGMASVKWLHRIIVTDQPFNGFFQSIDYTYWQRPSGLPSLTPLSEMQLKAQIARPAPEETVPAGKPYPVAGAAWTGDGTIAAVEVSTDGGRTWSRARLDGEPTPYTWRLWSYDWRAPAPGQHVLMARAIDQKGRVQPMERDADRRNYMINHVLAIPVRVE
ncbi:MAG: sulfite oxidase [Armatimonadota bacterium]